MITSTVAIIIFMVAIGYYTGCENEKKVEKMKAEYEHQLKMAEEEKEEMERLHERELERLYEKLEKYEP